MNSASLQESDFATESLQSFGNRFSQFLTECSSARLTAICV